MRFFLIIIWLCQDFFVTLYVEKEKEEEHFQHRRRVSSRPKNSTFGHEKPLLR